MNFRSKLALGFAAILALLLGVNSYVSLTNVQNLSHRLRSSFADSVIPLRTAQLADQAFDGMETEILNAIIERGPGREDSLARYEQEKERFLREFAGYEQGATHEPEMQEFLARYGVKDDLNKRQEQALDDIKSDYPLLEGHLQRAIALLRANDQAAAEAEYRSALPLFTKIDISTNNLMELEVEQGRYLDKESQLVAQASTRQIPTILTVAMLMGILLLFILARSVTEPLLRLTAAA
ncbi:MAG TPA: MCP four helix bundle domain-containing protein, partial [Terriglobales bacterium]